MDRAVEIPTTKNVKNSGKSKNGREWMMRGKPGVLVEEEEGRMTKGEELSRPLLKGRHDTGQHPPSIHSIPLGEQNKGTKGGGRIKREKERKKERKIFK